MLWDHPSQLNVAGINYSVTLKLSFLSEELHHLAGILYSVKVLEVADIHKSPAYLLSSYLKRLCYNKKKSYDTIVKQH